MTATAIVPLCSGDKLDLGCVMDIGSPNTEVQAQVDKFRDTFALLKTELNRVIVGQSEILDGVLLAFFAGGHVLLEGVPGLGKTMIVRTLAEAVDLKFSRIQFTPDLMPADILGTNLIVEDETGRKEFRFQAGPVFANILLADEINRATPKTQSALLEAMQERHVTIGGTLYPLEEPFMVLATQNPLEMEGTYTLPEAQLDRFLLKLKVEYPSAEELHLIAQRTTGAENVQVKKVLHSAREVLELRTMARQVPVATEVREHAVQLILRTHPESPSPAPSAKRYVRYGASPRGLQALLLSAKIFALLDERFHVSKSDINRAALPALRHRIILNFEGEAEGTSAETIIREAMEG